MKTQGTIDSKFLKLAENIGSFIEYWGFKQVHGKVWTLIFLSPEPVDANYLKNNLEISKALTSMTIKDLLFYKVILEVEKDRPGTQKYKINPDITQVIFDVLENRELKMLYEIQNSFRNLQQGNKKKSDPNIDTGRLSELGAMVDSAQKLLKSMTECSEVDFSEFENVTSLDDRH